MEKVSALNFDNFLDYLNYVVSPASHFKSRPKTLEQWATRLGYKSSSILSMVLKGQRVPSHDLIASIAFDLDLSEDEARYLQLLVQLEKEKRKNKDCSRTLQYLNKLKSHGTFNRISLDEFSYISQWHFFAIKNLVLLEDFREDYDWISNQLRKKVQPSKVKSSIEQLVKMGVLKRDKDGNLKKPTKGYSTGDTIPSSAIRSHHKEMISRGHESIDEIEMALRQISSLTLAIGDDDISKAKDKIIEFCQEFNHTFAKDKNADSIYQLNIQFFPHTLVKKGKQQ
ncbi:DUF4423 domain-containing protein [Halobacteriovorax sp. DPLXC-1]|uniref:DUF4423 domain-containing protein n=1 Tax=Halobacteriovorax sp. DPLXC-1 TaxID=3110771 RepID=UPI002FEEC6F0